MNNASVNSKKQAIISTMGGSKIEIRILVGLIPTIMRVLTCYFDKINETEDRIGDSSPKQKFIANHTTDANKGRKTGQKPLENIFGFSEAFWKIVNRLGFYRTFKTPHLQHYIYTTLNKDYTVIINSLYLFVSTLIPDAETSNI